MDSKKKSIIFSRLLLEQKNSDFQLQSNRRSTKTVDEIEKHVTKPNRLTSPIPFVSQLQNSDFFCFAGKTKIVSGYQNEEVNANI